MKTRFIYFVICLILVNCQESKSELIFKYSDKPTVLNCDIKDSKLFNEALYSFEEILIDNYANKNPNIAMGYSLFFKDFANNTTNFNNISNQHTLDVYAALLKVEGLWINKNNIPTLNYNHEIFQCIGENLGDKDFKTTFNALLSTNSMNIRMLREPLLSRLRFMDKDKYLGAFVALELYYSKLSNVDLSKKETTPTETKVKEEKDPHAGHNHD